MSSEGNYSSHDDDCNDTITAHELYELLRRKREFRKQQSSGGVRRNAELAWLEKQVAKYVSICFFFSVLLFILIFNC